MRWSSNYQLQDIASHRIHMEFALEDIYRTIFLLFEFCAETSMAVMMSSDDMLADSQVESTLTMTVSGWTPSAAERERFADSDSLYQERMRFDPDHSRPQKAPHSSCNSSNATSRRLHLPFSSATPGDLQISSSVRHLHKPSEWPTIFSRTEMCERLLNIGAVATRTVRDILQTSEIMLPGFMMHIQTESSLHASIPTAAEREQMADQIFPQRTTTCYPADISQLWRHEPTPPSRPSTLRSRLRAISRKDTPPRNIHPSEAR